MTTQFNKEEKDIISFLLRNRNFFCHLISWHYPLTEELLDKHKSFYNWTNISGNENILWTESLIEKYIDDLNWCVLTNNQNMPWSMEFLEKYESRLWGKFYGEGEHVNGHLSANEGLPWSEELIDKYRDRWEWDRLSLRHNLPWSVPFIEKYRDRWNWNFFSFNNAILENVEICKEFNITAAEVAIDDTEICEDPEPPKNELEELMASNWIFDDHLWESSFRKQLFFPKLSPKIVLTTLSLLA